MRKSSIVLGVLLAVFLVTAPAFAQGQMRLKISVKDDSGKPVSLIVRMTPADANLAQERSVTTNKKGQATIPNLEASSYQPTLDPGEWVISAVKYKARASDNSMMPEFEELDAVSNGVPMITFVGFSRGELSLTVTEAKAIQAARELAAVEETVKELKDLNAMLVRNDWDGILAKAPGIIEEHPDIAGGYYLYGVALWKSGRFEEAGAQLDKVQEIDPEQQGIAGVRAAMYLEYARQVAATDPAGAVPLAEKAAEAIRDQLEVTPDSKNDMVNLYSALEIAGNMDEAIVVLQRLVEKFPDDPNPYLRLADLQIESGMEDEAMATLDAMPGESAKVVDLLYNAAVVKYNEENFTAAVAATNKAIELDPERAMLYQLKGRALIASGDQAGAVAAFKEYIRLAGPDADTAVEQQLVEALEKQ